MDFVLSIRDLKTYFFLDEGTVRAVDGVNLEIPRGKTIGIVGESGCGKTVTAFSILQLISSPGRIISGEVILHREVGETVLTDLKEDGPEIRAVRGKEVSMIFQEPMTSLSPVHRVGAQIVEAIELHTQVRGGEARDRAVQLLARVGIPDPLQRAGQYPHEMSGGMRQRVMIAMALSCQPALLIADEPTTALDVTIQAQILELMRDLQQEFGMSIMLITHDLGLVAEMVQEVAVMYLGRVVEKGTTAQIFEKPRHPYTQALMQSIPGLGARKTKLKTIQGSVPDPFQKIKGCPFHPRCDSAINGVCDQGDPPLLGKIGEEQSVACLVYHQETSNSG